MKFLKKLFYTQRYSVTHAELSFKYESISGYVIAVDMLDIPMKNKKIIVDNTCHGKRNQAVDQIEDLDEVKKTANKISKVILKKARSKNKIEDLKHGCFINGKHIVKCLWEVDFDTLKFKPLTYEEWEKMKK